MSALPKPESTGIVEMVERLRGTFRSGRTRPRAWRETQLERLKALLRERKDDLLRALEDDLGKSPFEGWLAEIALVEKEIEHTLDHLREWMRPERVSTPMALQPARSRVYREPLGVACIIAPWNYPVQLALAPLVGAIAAGNCAVVKPSEIAAATSRVLAEVIPEYLDRDAIAVVEGGVPETTELLAQRFDHIFFTGSTRIGKVVMKAAAEHLTPVTLELGGKSPAIVDASADLEVTARRLVWGKFFNAGQTCVAPDYVLVDHRVEQALLDKLAATVREFYGADPAKSDDYARIVSDRHFQRLVGFLGEGETVCGGEHDAKQRYIAPTILTEIDAKAPVMEDEIFGPILPVLPVATMGEAIDFVVDRPKPLALYVFTQNREIARRVLDETSSGGACVNDTVAHLSVQDLPFGGVGDSGMGAYHGRSSFETFSHRKSVLDKSVRLDVNLRYPPYDDNKAKWVKRLM